MMHGPVRRNTRADQFEVTTPIDLPVMMPPSRFTECLLPLFEPLNERAQEATRDRRNRPATLTMAATATFLSCLRVRGMNSCIAR